MRHIAIGDPQAPFEKFLGILESHGLLASDGRLSPDTHLVSMGDHFDFGRETLREEARADGLRLLEWLASHPAEQVTILLGNHDLARVCELAPFDDVSFAEAQSEADAAYRGGNVDRERDAAFLRHYPFLSSAEIVARDYSTFSVAQQVLVGELLRTGRFRLAHARAGLLLVHAGVTTADLDAIAVAGASAEIVAQGLNAFLDARVARWAGGSLDLWPFHEVGDASCEGRGALYHRPADPDLNAPEHFVGPPRRRFDPRDLPGSFSTAIGHIRDQKCRELMPNWHDDRPPQDGPVRSLTIRGATIAYAPGAASDARLYFLDNGMNHAPIEDYELFDLDRRVPLRSGAFKKRGGVFQL